MDLKLILDSIKQAADKSLAIFMQHFNYYYDKASEFMGDHFADLGLLAKEKQLELFITLIFLCILISLWQLFKVIFSWKPPKKVRGGNTTQKNIKQYLPEIIGALFSFAVMSVHPFWALVAGVLGALAAHGGKRGYSWFFKRLTKESRAGEVLLIYEIVSIYVEAGYSLNEALNASQYLVRFTKKSIQKCLRSWGHGPQRALEQLGKDIDTTEVDALVGILKRAVAIGPEKMAGFLSEESMTMEKLRQMRVEQSLGVRPIVQTLYLIFPGLALLGVTVIPIGFYIAKQITSIQL